jgi:hypothetical protein
MLRKNNKKKDGNWLNSNERIFLNFCIFLKTQGKIKGKK